MNLWAEWQMMRGGGQEEFRVTLGDAACIAAARVLQEMHVEAGTYSVRELVQPPTPKLFVDYSDRTRTVRFLVKWGVYRFREPGPFEFEFSATFDCIGHDLFQVQQVLVETLADKLAECVAAETVARLVDRWPSIAPAPLRKP